MIDDAQVDLTNKGLIDKFELVCQDIFDDSFELPEKVDCVVIVYTIVTFVNSQDMLERLFKSLSRFMKPDGYLLITDFSYSPNQTLETYKDIGFYHTLPDGVDFPENFGSFYFHITEDKEVGKYEIF